MENWANYHGVKLESFFVLFGFVLFEKIHSKIFFVFFAVSSWGDHSASPLSSQTMKITRKCRGCHTPFAVDYRNSQKQRFCSDPACQRARRRDSQQQRRAKASDNQTASTQLQSASCASEAVWASQSPVLIGLISFLTDTYCKDAVRETLRRLSLRGQTILDLDKPLKVAKPPSNQRKTKAA